jgi:uncharacterized protein (TIGR03067 family)
MMLRLVFALAFGTLVAAGCKSSSTTSAQVQVDPDLEALQGKWIAESAERRGTALAADRARTIRLTINDENLEFSEGDRYDETVPFTIDASQEPKWIDVKVTRGPDQGKTALGIYEVNGRNLKLCWAEPGKPRPASFATSGGNAIECLRLRRVE